MGHVTDERVAIADCLPGGMEFTLLLSLAPVAAGTVQEDSDPAPAADDLLVTAAALQPLLHAIADRHRGPWSFARCEPANRPMQSYRGPAPAPFLSRQAAAWLVDRGIEHLVLDLPSADRADDGGRLAAHRIFFGLPAGSRRAGEARRPQASITELAWVPAEDPDGYYLLDLQIPAFQTDAAPSRPLLYPVQFE